MKHVAHAWLCVTCLVGLAGCITAPGNPETIFRHASGWASYEVRVDGHEAHVDVSYTWGDEVVVEMEARYAFHDSRRTFNATFWYEPDTGQLLRAWESVRAAQFGLPEAPFESETLWFPFGAHRTLPATTMLSPDLDLEPPQALTPFGLQSAVAWRQGSFRWGEADVEVTLGSDKWSGTATAPCQYQCAGGGNVSWTMEGETSRLWPTRAFLDRPGTRDVELVRTAAGESGGRVPLQAREPFAEPPHRQRCGHAPCEPPGWPVPGSFQYGLQALETSPLWAEWASDKQSIAPLFLHPGSCVLVAGEATRCSWTFDFSASPGPGTRVTVRAAVAAGQLLPPVVEPLEARPDFPPPPPHETPREQVPMDDLFTALWDVTGETGTIAHYGHQPDADRYPDVRGTYYVAVQLPEKDGFGRMAWLSPETGVILQIVANKALEMH